MKKLLSLLLCICGTALADNVFVTNDANHPINAVCVSGCSASASATPAGSTGDIQTNAGSGAFGAITPATGIAIFLATPSGANLASALTTALPASKGGTGLTSLGTGIATALGVNVGSAGAPVLLNGAGGTPSSLTGTNISGTAASLNIGGTVAGNTITTGTGTLTLGAGKTTTFDHTSTFTTTDAQTYTFPPTSATLARIDAANTFTGASATTNWTSNTQSASDNSTKLATTAYVDNQVTVGVGPNHAVYAAASPPTVDVGVFTIVKTGVDIKNAGTTAGFTVPSGRVFVCDKATAVVTSVTGAGSGTETFTLKESGSNTVMVGTTPSGAGTPAVNTYYTQDSNPGGGPYLGCAAGNVVNIVVSTSQSLSTTVTASVFIQGKYIQ